MDLPEEIQEELKSLSKAGQSLDAIAGHRATIDIYLANSFTKHLNALCNELKETRDQMSLSSAVASEQTKALVKTTKWYTWITGGLLLINILMLLLTWRIAK